MAIKRASLTPLFKKWRGLDPQIYYPLRRPDGVIRSPSASASSGDSIEAGSVREPSVRVGRDRHHLPHLRRHDAAQRALIADDFEASR